MKNWTKEETSILIKNTMKTLPELRKLLPDRSDDAILSKRMKIAIPPNAYGHNGRFFRHDDAMFDRSRDIIRKIIRNDPDLAKYQIHIYGEKND